MVVMQKLAATACLPLTSHYAEHFPDVLSEAPQQSYEVWAWSAPNFTPFLLEETEPREAHTAARSYLPVKVRARSPTRAFANPNPKP